MPGTGPPQVGTDFGDYHIEAVLGRGAMGVVYRARQRRLDRSVALKVLPTDLADEPGYRRRFVREAAALARLDSPHVVQIHDHGDLDGHLYLAMQLVSGPDLARLLDDDPLAPRRALRITAQLATALGDGHAVGVLHRDVKPSNVLVRPPAPHDPDTDDFVYLCDFGIARDAEGTSETVGVIGTLAYMAPERLNGDPATPASDVYSLGCLLWTLLVGEPPYLGSQPELIMGHVHGPVPQLSGHDPRTALLNGLLADMLAKDPARRPGTTAVRARIGEILATAGPAGVAASMPTPAVGRSAAAARAVTTNPAPGGITGPDPPPGSAVRPAGDRSGHDAPDHADRGPRRATRPALRSTGRRRGAVLAGVAAAVLLVVAGVLLAVQQLDPARTAATRLSRATPVGITCTDTAVPEPAARVGAVGQLVCNPGPDVGELRLVALSGDATTYLREVGRQDPQALPEGSCPEAMPARTRWSADGHQGTLLCYVLGSTTRFAWTFDDLEVVAVLDGKAQVPFPRDLDAVAAFVAAARYP